MQNIPILKFTYIFKLEKNNKLNKFKNNIPFIIFDQNFEIKYDKLISGFLDSTDLI